MCPHLIYGLLLVFPLLSGPSWPWGSPVSPWVTDPERDSVSLLLPSRSNDSPVVPRISAACHKRQESAQPMYLVLPHRKQAALGNKSIKRLESGRQAVKLFLIFSEKDKLGRIQ